MQDRLEEEEPEREPVGASRWARIVLHLRRVRFLQRLWSSLGDHLRLNISPELRDRLRRHLR